MSFAQTKNVQEGHAAGLKITCGTYTSTSVTTGTIKTGLTQVKALFLQPVKNAVLANQAVLASASQTMPTTYDGIVAIDTSNESGTWIAIGN